MHHDWYLGDHEIITCKVTKHCEEIFASKQIVKYLSSLTNSVLLDLIFMYVYIFLSINNVATLCSPISKCFDTHLMTSPNTNAFG